MSDKANNPQPDRAGSEPLDDIDVPTYTGGQEGPKQGSTPAGVGANDPTRVTENLYNRTGRAAPQSIPPKPAPGRGAGTAAGPTATTAGSTAAGAATGGQAAKSTPNDPDPTTAFAVPDHRPDNSEPLRSDAPTTSFDRSGEDTGQAPASPATETGYADTDFAPAGATNFAQGPAMVQPPAQPTGYPDQTVVAGGAVGATAATAVGGDGEPPAGPVRDHRRGTIDGGILLIRLLLGATLILTSIATFFQLGGATGLNGLEAEFAGYQLPQILAIAVPSMQLAAGVFLVFGLITPVFAAVATVVTAFTALHALTDSGAGLNVFAWGAAVMLSVILLGISVALQFTGPGLYSFDYGRRWARRPLASSWIFVILGIAGAVALWWFGAGVNPLS